MPPETAQQIPVNIEDEMRSSYIDYAMSVIIGRALPDVRDGLKPVHRRCLFAMHDLGNHWNTAYKKSARIVGDVIGKYHPHGDQAVYDTIVRMAQGFSMRYCLVDGQGNFGSVDGDPPAAMRYTEVRMARLTQELLADIDKETVDFGPNYDETLQEPLVLPTRIPNLLVNGSEGIAVGMATKIPPHNLSEVLAATVALIRNPEASLAELMSLVKGPDFPTAGIILGRKGIVDAYLTGRGVLHVRARAEIEPIDNGKREAIIVRELPYQVNKARMIEKIAELVREKRIEGIAELRDESDRRGIRVVMELRRDANAEVILNQLYKMTPMQSSFGINMLAIVGGQPLVLSLKEALGHFIDHRRSVVTRRCQHELRKARERAHILEGLIVALDHIDEIVELIKRSTGPAEARAGLMSRFGLSERQAQAILDMRLQRLTGLEREKIRAEHAALLQEIARLEAILRDEKLLLQVIVDELEQISATYGDARLTEIVEEEADIDIEDLIPEETVVVTRSHTGYIKRASLSEYRSQRRGGKGRRGMATKDEDFVTDLFVASTHDDLIIFTSRGRCFLLKVYQIPAGNRASRGKPLVNLIQLEEGEKVAAVLALPGLDQGGCLFFVTRKGRVKKTELTAYRNIRSTGLTATVLEEGDELVTVLLVRSGDTVLLSTRKGMSIRFAEMQVRAMGRVSRGVIGIKLRQGDAVVDAALLPPGEMDHDGTGGVGQEGEGGEEEAAVGPEEREEEPGEEEEAGGENGDGEAADHQATGEETAPEGAEELPPEEAVAVI
ncbi:MAG: DNA gyrase subunit A, partial [Deltaproteobacteria bacterium]|nr:DNA gyrase subunit A [Deltaproteobacteria bacterium]